MIQNIEDVIKFLKVGKLHYWTVQVKEGDNGFVFKADEDLLFDDNVKNFRETMSLSTGTKFFLKAGNQKVGNKGNFYEEFKNVSDFAAVNGLPNNQIGERKFTMDEVREEISKELEKERIRRKIDSVKEENEALKQQINAINTPVNRIIVKLGDHIPQILGFIAERFLPQKPSMQIAGMDYNLNYEPVTTTASEAVIQPATEPPTDDNQNERLAGALEQWVKADPDFLQVIEFISNFAATGQKIDAGFIKLDYATVKAMLLKK
ncbi:MAG: hypothetical protein Q7U47_01310 [Paludibacter sp.]|nr:hypothetical protein [Paludibacter sp.]